MRIAALAGLFACAAIFAATNSSQVSAEALDLLRSNSSEQIQLKVGEMAIAEISAKKKKDLPEAIVAVVPEVKAHQVQAGETLSSVAEKYQTTWARLFNKNEQIVNPDVLKVGDMLNVPLANENLKDRALPVVVAPVSTPILATSNQEQTTKKATKPMAQPQAAVPVNPGAVAGNTYAPGYCTWYAKNMRPDLPNNLGNANTWVSRAAAQGLATGAAPRAGAIGQQGMHVVYVQSVNPDGTVSISEMNYKGLYVVSTRTVPASTFTYIY